VPVRHNGGVTKTSSGLLRLAVGAAIVASLSVSGCVNAVSGTAVRAKDAIPLDVPPLDQSGLDDVMLSLDELNDIVGATDMEITVDLREMTDHSADVSDPDCLGAIYGAEEPVYASTGWTEVRDQVAREPGDDNDHWVEQTAVLYPSAARAEKFFEKSKESWADCANGSLSINDMDESYVWNIDELNVDDTMLTQRAMQEDAEGWGCQHALAAVSNLTVETWACGYSISDEAATIASEMIANAAKK